MEELVKVNPSEYGIEENKANELIGNLPQLQNERDVLENQYNEVIKMDIESIETSKVARELRLKIKENRTKGIIPWHKTTKEVFLRAGQYVDALKNREIAINERMEDNLEKIEDYFRNLEAERFEAEMKVRLERVHKFNTEITLHDVRQFNNELFELFLSGVEKEYNDKKEAEAEAERIRLENERIEAERLAEEKRIEAERIEAQRIENERLKKEAEKREAELKLEREKAEAERKRLAEIQAKKDAEQAEILRKEQAEKARIEKELQAKKDAEIKAEQNRLAEIERHKKEAEKLAKAPIKKQLSAWVELFSIPTTNVDNKVSKEIIEKFNAFKSWSQKQIENL